MNEQFDIVSHLYTISPVVGVLIWVVIHFKGEIKTKDERISKLTDELIDVSRDQIKINSEMRNILEVIKNK